VLYGFGRDDVSRLIDAGRMVPVFTDRIGSVDQRMARELVEAGRYVAPRRLATALAAQILELNPLWRIPKRETKAARSFLHDMRAAVAAEGGSLDPRMVRLLETWVSFESDGVADFMTAMTNRGMDAPAAFGPANRSTSETKISLSTGLCGAWRPRICPFGRTGGRGEHGSQEGAPSRFAAGSDQCSCEST
jgi:hypothetical protein